MAENLNDIIDGCRKKDRNSQEQLYRLCYAATIGVCKRYTHCDDDANDRFNRGMEKVYKKLGQYKGDGPFMGWVWKIMVNTSIDEYRIIKRYDEVELTEEPAAHNTFLPEAYSEIEGREVLKEIRELPGKTGLVYNMFAIDGFTHKEIAEKLGIEIGTSWWHVNEARKQIKAKMDVNLIREYLPDAIRKERHR